MAGIGYLFFIYRELEKQDEYLCSRGFGETSIRLRILNLENKQLVDSIRLTIRSGASAEKVVDTLLKQEEYIAYNFFIPQYDDCESYWFEVSNKLYHDDIHFADTGSNAGIKKGAANEGTLYLTPATKVKLVLRNELKEFNGDTIFIAFKRKDNKEANAWDYFTSKHFEAKEEITEFFSLESGVDHKAIVIQKNNQSVDTLFSNEFYTRSFDTLDVNFTLKKGNACSKALGEAIVE
jgi:hypothetical protein